MSDIPVKLRPRAAVPSGWPPDVSPNQVITAAHINAIRSSVYAWPGDVDGQGHTLSNVHLAGATGVLTDPTTTAGDILARDGSALGRFGVGAAGQVLTVDPAQPAKLRWATPATAPVASVFGRLGAVVAQVGDYTAAQVTGAVVDTLTTRGDIFARGAAATGRFPAGADGQVLRADAAQPFGLRWSGESVPSVFGRTGPIAAQAGDYDAAKVTNAVSVLGSYPDPAWLTSLSWVKLIGTPATFPAAPHTHDAAAVVSGVLATARLGTGVADANVYLRGDGTWAAAGSGGGGGVISVFGRAGTVVAQTGDYTAAQVIGAVANPTTIKGDLMVRNDLNAIVRLPVGASGQVLQADSALTVGMKWTTLGAAVQTPWVTDVDAANFQLVNVRRLGVAIGLPAYPLDVVGDINFTGVLRQNGAPVSFGGSQTPWTSDIDAAGFRLINAGTLSIGTTAPLAKLDATTGSTLVSNIGAGLGGFRLATDPWNSAPALLMGVDGGLTASWIQAIQAGAATNPILLNPIGSGVGIGVTTAPASRLDIEGPQDATGGLTLGTTGADPTIYGYQIYRGAAGELKLIGNQGGAAAFVFGNPSERMRISAAGNVGVGVVPAAPLHVGADLTRQLYLSSSSDPVNKQMRLGYDVTTNSCVVEALLNGSGRPLLLNPTGGNVGIATANPANRFTIADRSSAASDAMSGVAGFSLSAQTGAVTDDNLLMGVYAGDYAWIQAAKAGTATRSLLLNPNGGKVGVCTTAPIGNLSINPQSTPSGVANALQLTIGEQGSNSNYYLSLGYMYDGANWGGSIQAIATGAPCNLILNGLGGRVGVGLVAPAVSMHVQAPSGEGKIRVQALGAGASDSVALELMGGGTNAYWSLLTNRPDVFGAADTIGFYKNAGTTGIKLSIKDNGFVGIGMAGASYALDVAGDVNCSGVFRVGGVPLSFAPAVHTHDAAAIVSGVLAPARLGTGTPNSSVFLRGDGVWAAAGSGSQTPWAGNIDAAGFELTNVGLIRGAANAALNFRINENVTPSLVNQSISFSSNGSNTLTVYVKFANGTQKVGSITLS